MDNVVVIDVETSNPNQSSICQVGAVRWVNGKRNELSTLINPRTYFARSNTAIHGIGEADIVNSPEFSEFLPVLKDFIGDSIIASYGSFDRSAINKASELIGHQPPNNTWLDISTVVRRTWPEKYSQKGFSLANVTNHLNIPLESHHDALADAIAASSVLETIVKLSGQSVSEWVENLKRHKKTRTQYPSNAKELPPPNEDGPLYGEVVCFTGDLSMPRSSAQVVAAFAGCEVKSSVTKKTTLLVVGSPNFSLIGDKGKSSKQLKAESLAESGHPIRLISEEDFISITKTES